MKTLVCPQCGTYPATVFNKPTGKDTLGFTTVVRQVRCPKCGNGFEGEPGRKDFQRQLESWKVELSELPPIPDQSVCEP